MNYLGKYLKKRLKEMKVSEREISAKCGISHSYLNQLIKGVNPSTKKNISPTLSTFEKLSVGFGIPVEQLQKIARGLINAESACCLKNENFDEGTNNQYSQSILNCIMDFQKIINDVGISDNEYSEEELKTLMSKVKETVKKHLNESDNISVYK